MPTEIHFGIGLPVLLYGSESFSKGNDNANKVIKIQNPFDVKPNKLVFEMMEYHSIHQQVVLKI